MLLTLTMSLTHHNTVPSIFIDDSTIRAVVEQ